MPEKTLTELLLEWIEEAEAEEADMPLLEAMARAEAAKRPAPKE